MSIEKCDKTKFDIPSIIDEINSDAEIQMGGIDWEKNAADITRKIKLGKFKKHKPGSYFGFTFKMALFAAAGIFIVGISLGYFMSGIRTEELPAKSLGEVSTLTLSKLETTLNRREISIYFEQAHLLITEIMEVCRDETIMTDSKYINNRKVKELLKKNRLFDKDSSDPQWLVSKDLLKKIEWVLIEILMSDGRLSCEKQRELQQYITKERLLFKLRLLSSEASLSEV